MNFRRLAASLLCAFLASDAGAVLSRFDYVEAPVNGVARLLNLINTDTPLPPSGFKKGAWQLEVEPTWFRVDQVADTTYLISSGGEFIGQDLGGWGGAATVSYALSDTWLAYGIVSGVTVEGGITGRMRPDFRIPLADSFSIKGRNTMMLFNTGLAMDLVGGDLQDRFSAINTFGLVFQYYRTQMSLDALPGAASRYDHDLEIEGSGVIPGISYGIACSSRLGERFALGPYMVLVATLGRPELEAKVRRSASYPVGTAESGPAGSMMYPMLGVNLSYVPWGLRFNLTSPLLRYYTSVFDGLKVTELSISKYF